MDDERPASQETFVDFLGDAVLSSAVALALGALISSMIYLSVVRFGLGDFELSIVPAALFLTIFAVLVGAIPAVLVGAPIYAALAYRGWASYLSALVVGAFLGMGLLHVIAGNWYALSYFYPYPISVALLTHYFARRRRLRRIGVAAT